MAQNLVDANPPGVTGGKDGQMVATTLKLPLQENRGHDLIHKAVP